MTRNPNDRQNSCVGLDVYLDRRAPPASTADLKSLYHKPRGSLSGTSDREAVLKSTSLLVPMAFRSSRKGAAETYRELRKVGTSLVVGVALNALSTVWTWRERARSRRELAARSDHELQDIGLYRADIAEEVSKPFWRA